MYIYADEAINLIKRNKLKSMRILELFKQNKKSVSGANW